MWGNSEMKEISKIELKEIQNVIFCYEKLMVKIFELKNNLCVCIKM